MMPYAANDKLSTSPIEGGIEITQTEYAEALSAILEGQRLSIEGRQMALSFPPSPEAEPEPQPDPKLEDLLAQARAARASAYRQEADPRFFKWQRGEGSEQDWLDKVAEIRARYPYAEGHGDEGATP